MGESGRVYFRGGNLCRAIGQSIGQTRVGIGFVDTHTLRRRPVLLPAGRIAARRPSDHERVGAPCDAAEQRSGGRIKKDACLRPVSGPSLRTSRPVRAAQGTAREARRKAQGRLSLPTFFGEAKKVGRRAGANSPRGLSGTASQAPMQTAPAASPGNRSRFADQLSARLCSTAQPQRAAPPLCPSAPS